MGAIGFGGDRDLWLVAGVDKLQEASYQNSYNQLQLASIYPESMKFLHSFLPIYSWHYLYFSIISPCDYSLTFTKRHPKRKDNRKFLTFRIFHPTPGLPRIHMN